MPSIFISCVSNEFGNYRDAIRKDLSRPNLEAKIQEDFTAYGGATIEKLDEYIQHCEAVIHIVGDMTGSMANELSLLYIKNKYTDFGIRFPFLQSVLNNEAGLSYTQWEAYLAIYHNKRLFVATPLEDAPRNTNYKKEESQIVLQQAHLQNLRSLGYYDEIHFSTEDGLIKKLYQSKLGDVVNAIPKIKPIKLPYKSLENAFKGREEFIKELRKLFLIPSKNGITVAMHALGGMGKTRLAIEYAWQHKPEYTALLFVNADKPELLKTNIAQLSDPKILNLPEHEAKEESIKYDAVVRWLNQHAGWLLILDNIDTEEAAKKVEEILPQFQHGHILLTARIENWSRQVKKKRLDVLSEDSAMAFLLETTIEEREQTDNDEQLAGEIAADLGHLALALEQARAYIVSNQYSFDTYRNIWQGNSSKVLEWFDEQQMQYPKSVAITWQTSFDQLSNDGKILLNRLAWLSPEPIPKTLLETEPEEAEKIDAQAAWVELKKYSLISSRDDKKAFTVHKLVQDITLNKMNDEQKEQTLKDALDWLDTAFKGDPQNVSDWPYLEPLVPHVLSIINYAEYYKIDKYASGLMSQIASMFFAKAKYHIAERLMIRALQIDEQNLGSNDPVVATDLNNLSLLFRQTNRLSEAEKLIRRALEIGEKSLRVDSQTLAVRLKNLALILQDSNKLNEAEVLVRRALKIEEEKLGDNHPNVAVTLNNLALLLKDTDRLGEIESLIKRALNINEQNFGSSHPNVATDLNSLAQVLRITGRLEESEVLMRKALEIGESYFGPDHPLVAIYLSNLALLLQDTKHLKEAEFMMRRALKIDEQVFGPHHPIIAKDLNNLGYLLQYTDRLNEAEDHMRRSLEIFKQKLGINHPDVSTSLNNLAVLLQDIGSIDEAELLLREALSIDEKNFEYNQLNLVTTLNNLALLLCATKRLTEAEPLMKRSLIILDKINIDYSEGATILSNYVELLKEMDKSQDEINNIISTLFTKQN